MEAKRRAGANGRKRKTAGAARVGAKVTRSSHNGSFEQAIQGTAEAARRLGADVGSLVQDAARGAVEAADRIGSAAGRAVRATVAEAVSGTKALGGRHDGARTTRRRRA